MKPKTPPSLTPTILREDPEITKSLGLVKKKNAELPAVITTEEEYTRIAAIQKVTHDLILSIKAWYKKHKDPIAKALDALRAEEKTLLQEPAEWEKKAGSLMGDWFFKKEAEAQKERDRLQKKLDAEAAAQRKKEIAALKKSGDKEAASVLADAPILAPEAEVKNEAALDGRNFRDDVEVSLVDIDLVPVEYLRRELNVSACKKAWNNGVTTIPGVSLKPVKNLVNR